MLEKPGINFFKSLKRLYALKKGSGKIDPDLVDCYHLITAWRSGVRYGALFIHYFALLLEQCVYANRMPTIF